MAQNMKTDTEDKFLALTEKQQDFVIELAAGATQIDAYKKAYSAESMSTGAIRVEASRLAARPHIALIIDTLAAQKIDTANCSREQHMNELARLRARAETAGNISAALNAEIARGKVAGHYVDKIQEIEAQSPHELLDELYKVSPELAGAVAEQNGIKTWKPPHSIAKPH